MAAFQDLAPGQLARVKRMHARPDEQLPPIVVIESTPEACGDGTCPDLRVTARNPETGRELVYHRPPRFEVELWGTAVPSPDTFQESS